MTFAKPMHATQSLRRTIASRKTTGLPVVLVLPTQPRCLSTERALSSALMSPEAAARQKIVEHVVADS
jgi:endonuclease V-like protein UPF0215 family